MCVLKHQTVSGFSRIARRTRAPSMVWGFASAPRPSRPGSSPRAVLRPAFRAARVRAGAKTRMALCPPSSLVPLSLGFCSFSFSTEAQPRNCASFLLQVLQGPGAGARTYPRPGAPLPLPLSPPCPVLRSPHSHRDCTELAAPRVAPSGGRVGRSSSPSRRLELSAGTRCLAAGGAKLHTSRLLQHSREGLSMSGTGDANS